MNNAKRVLLLSLMTDEDEANFARATKCHICDNTHTRKDIHVSDHFHLTGNYRGSAQQDCNLKLRINTKKNSSYTSQFERLW